MMELRYIPEYILLIESIMPMAGSSDGKSMRGYLVLQEHGIFQVVSICS